MGGTDGDSPFSITANVAGLLTFVVAIAAAAYARITYLRNGDDEFVRVKHSLSWYKTESQWLSDLLAALQESQQQDDDDDPDELSLNSVARGRNRTEYQMYAYVMEDLLNLENRLLDIVADIEARASSSSSSSSGNWTFVSRRWHGDRSSVAVAWLAVRTKALELARQREALTARVQFMHMSMISSRLRDFEMRTRQVELRHKEQDHAVTAVLESHAKDIQRLETIMSTTIAKRSRDLSKNGRGDTW